MCGVWEVRTGVPLPISTMGVSGVMGALVVPFGVREAEDGSGEDGGDGTQPQPAGTVWLRGVRGTALRSERCGMRSAP